MSEQQSLREWLGRDRGQIALVFTDIVGSTKTANLGGDDQWMDILKKHFAKARFYKAKTW
jgi:class 3 adenylate cyclase